MLPRWEPVVTMGKGGVVVSFVDARVLPWKDNRGYKEEPILVVADRVNKGVVADDGFYLAKVDNGNDGLRVERGLALKEMGVKESLGAVVLVVRPPKRGGAMATVMVMVAMEEGNGVGLFPVVGRWQCASC